MATYLGLHFLKDGVHGKSRIKVANHQKAEGMSHPILVIFGLKIGLSQAFLDLTDQSISDSAVLYKYSHSTSLVL
jgi:hypothetical protein